jgi:hypothetical protein
MKRATESEFMDWYIRTVVGIDNPDEWKPGDADRYFVRGVAEVKRDDSRFNYTSNEPVIFTTGHFTDPRLAPSFHGEARMELEQAIGRLRIK